MCAAALVAHAARGRASALFGPSVWRGTRDRRAVALTFDDGPSESTPGLLEVLEREAAPATFFQCGFHVDRLPQVARQAAEAGHEIGNHTWSHAILCRCSPRAIHRELERTQRVIENATGRPPRLFRAPYGVRWFGLRPAQRRLGLLGVMWTTIALDWKLPAARIVSRLLAGACPGAIFCLHDGRGLATRPDIGETLEAVRRLIPALRARGFRLETVSQILCPTTT